MIGWRAEKLPSVRSGKSHQGHWQGGFRNSQARLHGDSVIPPPGSRAYAEYHCLRAHACSLTRCPPPLHAHAWSTMCPLSPRRLTQPHLPTSSGVQPSCSPTPLVIAPSSSCVCDHMHASIPLCLRTRAYSPRPPPPSAFGREHVHTRTRLLAQPCPPSPLTPSSHKCACSALAYPWIHPSHTLALSVLLISMYSQSRLSGILICKYKSCLFPFIPFESLSLQHRQPTKIFDSEHSPGGA